ncbi:MAG: heavy-metal-associated domain-containing protein [Propionibacteriaceae bacterium]|nr:heavy-metal-associated domain-containing protein [Propionibacteriaceae bacterium]
MDTVYTVTGMTCQHCVSHVKEEVGAIPGVEGVSLDLDSGRLVVSSAAPIGFDRVTAAVQEAGEYTVAPA